MGGFLNISEETEIFSIRILSYIMIIMAVLTFISLTRKRAAYGRYYQDKTVPGSDILVNAKLAWVVQEFPSFAVAVYFAFFTEAREFTHSANKIILILFIFHYFQRTFIYSFLIRGGKPTPVFPFVLACIFCSYNGYIQGRYHSQYASYPGNYTSNINFIFGTVLCIAGMVINIHSDHVLRNLRKPGETGYKIPRGKNFFLDITSKKNILNIMTLLIISFYAY